MTDAEYEAQKARVGVILDRWVKPIGLGWWRIDVEFKRTSGSELPSGMHALASCQSQWKYLRALITVYCETAESADDDDLEYHIVHELMHIFLSRWPALEGAEVDEHEEFAATTLAKGFIWARDMTQRGDAPALPKAEARKRLKEAS